MRCKYCGFTNGEDDHRCLRCGRRQPGVVIAAPASYSGANALAVAAALVPVAASPEPRQRQEPPRTAAPPAQPALFPATASNVIPFDQLQRQKAGKLTVQKPTGQARRQLKKA